ncbi:MAG: FHA domain-containing protein [Bacteroidia bacterium]|nr:FHA domain-containing protein [Bacteroidia bacterium]
MSDITLRSSPFTFSLMNPLRYLSLALILGLHTSLLAQGTQPDTMAAPPVPIQAAKYELDLITVIPDADGDFKLWVSVRKNGSLYDRAMAHQFQVTDTYIDRKTGDSVTLSYPIRFVEDKVTSLVAAGDTTEANYALHVRAQADIYLGEAHTFTVKLIKGSKGEVTSEDQLSLPIGSANAPIIPGKSGLSAGDAAVVGALAVVLLLLILSEGVPLLLGMQFRREFVMPFSKYRERRVQGISMGARASTDPISGERIQDNDLVVAKCEHVHTLASWQANNNRCAYYPDACKEGIAHISTGQFFLQQGLYRQLNWLWFGALGGLIAWTLFRLLNLAGYVSWVSAVVKDPYAAYSLAQFSLSGLSLGLGLGFAFAWVDERGQSRNFSWQRVLVRAGLSGLAGWIICLLGELIRPVLSGVPYIHAALVWSLFGAGLGTVLSFNSAINTFRGLSGGAVAALLAFNAYYLPTAFFQHDELPRALGFILMGAVLGVLISYVIRRLEDFYLVYLAPVQYNGRINHISKWLKAGMEIFIGNDTSSYVFIKWDDTSVRPQHARLKFHNNRVQLTPLAETLVEGKVLPLNEAYTLKDGDIIQLGKDSRSRMQYRERVSVK